MALPRCAASCGLVSIATPSDGAAAGSTLRSASQSEDAVVVLAGGLCGGGVVAVAASLTAWLAGPARFVVGAGAPELAPADGLRTRLMVPTLIVRGCRCPHRPRPRRWRRRQKMAADAAKLLRHRLQRCFSCRNLLEKTLWPPRQCVFPENPPPPRPTHSEHWRDALARA